MSNRNRGGGNKRKKQNNNNNNNNKKKFDAEGFWGKPEAIPNPEGFETSTPDPVAVVNSLGQPPLPGHGAASPHYFKLVYGRATQLAGALAMAGEIDDLTPDDPPEPEVVEAGNEAIDSDAEVDGNAVDGNAIESEDEPAETDADEDSPLVEASADDEE